MLTPGAMNEPGTCSVITWTLSQQRVFLSTGTNGDAEFIRAAA